MHYPNPKYSHGSSSFRIFALHRTKLNWTEIIYSKKNLLKELNWNNFSNWTELKNLVIDSNWIASLFCAHWRTATGNILARTEDVWRRRCSTASSPEKKHASTRHPASAANGQQGHRGEEGGPERYLAKGGVGRWRCVHGTSGGRRPDLGGRRPELFLSMACCNIEHVTWTCDKQAQNHEDKKRN